MKMTKLLTGAATVALLSGAAHAQIDVENTDGDTSNTFPSQMDLAEAAYQDTLLVDLGASDYSAITSLGVTDDVTLTLSLSGGLSFSTFLSNSNVVNTTDTDCIVEISADGSNGGDTVSFTSDANFDPTACGDGDLEITLPIDIEGTGNVSYELTLSSTGTVLGSGSYDASGATGTQAFYQSSDAIDVSFDSSSVSIDLSAEYELFGSSGSSNTTTSAGEVDFDLATSLTFSVGTGGADDTDVSVGNMFTGGELTVTVPSPAGIGAVTFMGQTETLGTDGVVTFDLDTTDLSTLETSDQTIGLVAATGDDAAAIANQSISAGLTFDFADTDLLSDDSDYAGTAAVLQRQGSNSITFEWVGDADAATGNVFRFTGFGDELPTIRVTLTNALAGDDFNDEFEMTPSNSLNNGELIVTGADLEAAAGDFGRADISFSVEAGGVEVRRLLVGSNGTLTDFGDEND